MRTATVTVELSSPQTVDGRPATYQSLWLLVRLLHAQCSGCRRQRSSFRQEHLGQRDTALHRRTHGPQAGR